MSKDIGRMYKYSQSQLSTSTLQAPISSSSYYQIPSAIASTITSVPSFTDKNKNNSVLCSQNTIQNNANITNNDNIQSCETPEKQILEFQQFQHLIIIHNILLPHPQVDWLLTHPRYYLRLVNNICVF